MAESLELTAEVRTSGKHWSRGLRDNKQVPAVVYGPKVKNMNISLSEKEVEKYSKQQFENTIFVLKSKDSKINGVKVLKKATQVHPLSRRPVHLDLFAIDLTKTIRVSVEVRYEGRALGIKEGGVFNAVRRDVEVECLPSEIPAFIAIDITQLGLGDSMHVSELTAPTNVKIITLPTETLCTVVTVEEEKAAPVAAAAAADGAAPAAGAAAPAAGAAAPAAGAAAPAAGAAAKPEKK